MCVFSFTEKNLEEKLLHFGFCFAFVVDIGGVFFFHYDNPEFAGEQ